MGEFSEAISTAESVQPPVSHDIAELETPVIRSLSEFEDAVAHEETSGLFLRWTPNLKADQKEGTVSKNLGSRYPEAGISVHPLNPFPEMGYGLNERYRMEGGPRGDRKYYLLKGEVVKDETGRQVLGNDGESLLKPESIAPIAEISINAIQEAQYRRLAFEAINDEKFGEPGEMMEEIRDTISKWTLERESSEELRQRTLAGIDTYLELHQAT